MEDHQIIALFFARNEDAIEATRQKYGPYCRRIAMDLLSQWMDAEECFSDALLSLWHRIPPEQPRELRTYLGRIIRNLSISRFRKDRAQKRYAGMEVLLSELEDCLPHPQTVELVLEGQALSDTISCWLDGLSPTDRALFIRRYWYGEALQDLAGEAGLSPAKLAQAMLKLRKKLKNHLESEGVEL